MRQEDLANELGVEQSTVSRLLRGLQGFSHDVVIKLADLAKVDSNQIFGHAGTMPRSVGDREAILRYLVANGWPEGLAIALSEQPTRWTVDTTFSMRAKALRSGDRLPHEWALIMDRIDEIDQVERRAEVKRDQIRDTGVEHRAKKEDRAAAAQEAERVRRTKEAELAPTHGSRPPARRA